MPSEPTNRDAVQRGMLVALADSARPARQRSGILTGLATFAVRTFRPVGRAPIWVAASLALLLVGGVAGVAVAVALSRGPQSVAGPTDTHVPSPEVAPSYAGSGTVIERDGVIELCLGGEFQLYPPACLVPVVLEGWDWSQTSVSVREAGSVRFTDQDVTITGTVRLRGSLTSTPTLVLTKAPIQGGLSGSAPDAVEPIAPSGRSEDELRQIVESSLSDTIGVANAMIVDGTIQASVAFDDGRLQDAADARFGPGVVYVSSLLRPVDESATSEDAAMLLCGATPVPARALTESRWATTLPPEIQSVLANPLTGTDGQLADWLVVRETSESVVIMREREEPIDMGAGDVRTHDLVAIGAGAEQAMPLDPPWGIQSLTNCTPTIDLGMLTEAAIALDPDALPESRDERIALLVTERACNSGQPATNRVELVELTETETTVEIVIGIKPNEGGTCPSNPPTPFTVELQRQLADRTILNAVVVPAREITRPGS